MEVLVEGSGSRDAQSMGFFWNINILAGLVSQHR